MNCVFCNKTEEHTHACGCEFQNVHEPACKLQIPLLKSLERAKNHLIASSEFESAASVRDAMIFIRKVRSEPAQGAPSA